MANKDNPRGFVAIDAITGGDYIGTFRNALIKSAYADNLAKGDPIKFVNDTDNTYIQRAGADDDIDGVFVGCAFKRQQSNGFGTVRGNWPGGQVVSEGEVVADVILDKTIEFVVQVANPNSTANHADNVIGLEDQNKLVKIVATEAADNGPRSLVELDGKAASVGASDGKVRLVRPYKGLNNDVTEDFGKWVVVIE